jgi:hypothetical protein
MVDAGQMSGIRALAFLRSIRAIRAATSTGVPVQVRTGEWVAETYIAYARLLVKPSV